MSFRFACSTRPSPPPSALLSRWRSAAPARWLWLRRRGRTSPPRGSAIGWCVCRFSTLDSAPNTRCLGGGYVHHPLPHPAVSHSRSHAQVLLSSAFFALKEVLYKRYFPLSYRSPLPVTDACLCVGLIGAISAVALVPWLCFLDAVGIERFEWPPYELARNYTLVALLMALQQVRSCLSRHVANDCSRCPPAPCPCFISPS